MKYQPPVLQFTKKGEKIVNITLMGIGGTFEMMKHVGVANTHARPETRLRHCRVVMSAITICASGHQGMNE